MKWFPVFVRLERSNRFGRSGHSGRHGRSLRYARSLLVAVMLVAAFGSAAYAGGRGEVERPQQLVVVNWADYGSDDPEFVADFEARHGVRIVHEYMASEEELLTKLRTGGIGIFDVVLPNSSILPQAIAEGLLQPIDTARLSNYADVIDTFRDVDYTQRDGEVYAVPWVWGSTSIAYNTDLVTDPIDSVSVFWDEAYRGRVAIRDDYNDAVMLAAMHLGQDPNNPSDLDAIRQALLDQKPYNVTYWRTGDEFSTLFANEQIAIGLAWSGQTLAMKNDGLPIGYVIPREGTIGWVDYWGIVRDTPNEEIAYAFVNEMISRRFQLEFVRKGGPAPVNANALAAVDPKVRDLMGMSLQEIDRLHFIEYRDPQTKQDWNEIWQEVKAR